MDSLAILSAKKLFPILLDDETLKTKDQKALDSLVSYVRDNLLPVMYILVDRKEANNMMHMAQQKLSWQYVYCCLRLFHDIYKEEGDSLHLLGSHMEALEKWTLYPQEMKKVENVALFGAVRYDPEVVEFTAKHFGPGLKELHLLEPKADMLDEFDKEYFFNQLPHESEVMEWDNFIRVTPNLTYLSVWQCSTGPFKKRNVLEILQKEWAGVKEVDIKIDNDYPQGTASTGQKTSQSFMSFATLYRRPKSQLHTMHVEFHNNGEDDLPKIVTDDSTCLDMNKFCQKLQMVFPNIKKLNFGRTALFHMKTCFPVDMMPLIGCLGLEIDEGKFVEEIKFLAANFPKLTFLHLYLLGNHWAVGEKVEEVEAMVQLQQLHVLQLICHEISAKMMHALFQRMPNMTAWSCIPKIFGKLSETSLKECFTPSPKHIGGFHFGMHGQAYFEDHNEYEMSREEAKRYQELIEKLAKDIPTKKISFIEYNV